MAVNFPIGKENFTFFSFTLITLEPIDVYRRPCVNSHWTAEFRKDEPLSQKEQWTKVPRFVHKNSEMTK